MTQNTKPPYHPINSQRENDENLEINTISIENNFE